MMRSTGFMRPKASVAALEAWIGDVERIVPAMGTGLDQRTAAHADHLMATLAAVVGTVAHGLAHFLAHQLPLSGKTPCGNADSPPPFLSHMIFRSSVSRGTASALNRADGAQCAPATDP